VSEPVIEASSNLRFAPFNIAYPGLKEHVEKSELDPSLNLWELVFDFTKNKNTEEVHFSQLPPSEWEFTNMSLPDSDAEPEKVFDYPMRYGGTLSDEPPQVESEHGAFAITTSAAEAMQAYS